MAARVSGITSGLRNADGGAPNWASAGSLSSCVPPGILPRVLRREKVRLATRPHGCFIGGHRRFLRKDEVRTRPGGRKSKRKGRKCGRNAIWRGKLAAT